MRSPPPPSLTPPSGAPRGAPELPAQPGLGHLEGVLDGPTLAANPEGFGCLLGCLHQAVVQRLPGIQIDELQVRAEQPAELALLGAFLQGGPPRHPAHGEGPETTAVAGCSLLRRWPRFCT